MFHHANKIRSKLQIMKMQQLSLFLLLFLKVAGSIPDEKIGFFNSSNPSSRIMALGLTQPLTEMITRNLPGE
jgi:hypothetical protein